MTTQAQFDAEAQALVGQVGQNVVNAAEGFEAKVWGNDNLPMSVSYAGNGALGIVVDGARVDVDLIIGPHSTQNGQGPYTSPQSLIAGVNSLPIDPYARAAADTIIGDVWSSFPGGFSATATNIGDVPLVSVQNLNPGGLAATFEVLPNPGF